MSHSDRLDQLERALASLRRQNCHLCVMLVALVSVVLLGMARPSGDPQEVHAHSFVLDDADGRPRGEFLMRDGAPTLRLSDSRGHVRVGLAGADDGAGVIILSEDDKPQLELKSSKQKGSRLEAYDSTGKRRLLVGAMPETPGIILLGSDGAALAGLRADHYGAILLKDETGKTRIGLIGSDNPAISLLGEDGNARAQLLLVKGRGSAVLSDIDSKLLWSAP